MKYTNEHDFLYSHCINSAYSSYKCKYCDYYSVFRLNYLENKMELDSEIIESCISANDKLIKDIIE